MTSTRRNLAVLLFVLALLGGSLYVIETKPTRLGLDLRGGVELVYQGRATPKVPEVTPQAVDDAIETIRKRTDALGVSEPEIQRAGADQISVGLPDVENAQRAIEQVGTTAQLQFYDWEPNVFTSRGPLTTLSEALGGIANPQQASQLEQPLPLPDAVERAGKAKPRAEAVDVPPDGVDEALLRRNGVDPADQAAVRQFYDRRNDTGQTKLYLFGPGKGAARKLLAGPDPTCKELLSDFESKAPPPAQRGERKAKKGSTCEQELTALGSAGPPPGSEVLTVPRGIVVVKAERPEGAGPKTPDRYYILEDDSELSGNDIKNPEQNFDQRTNEPIVTMDFTDRGRKGFAAATKREAQRGSEQIRPAGAVPDDAFQRFAITLDNEIVSLATIDFLENPEGIDGRTGAQINGIGNIQETQDLAESLRIGALPIELKLISQTKVSATLGQQALDQGLLAAGAGLALTLLFLLLFYRVLGVVAGLALVTYAVLLFGLVKLIPITLSLPGIAGLILTLGVAADANIVMYERIKEEVRGGHSIPRSISTGYAKGLRTIIDANVVTIGVAFILFMLATGGVKGFAFTLGVGTLTSLLTAVLATSAILGSISRTRLLGSRHALGAGRQRPPRHFDFVGRSKWFFSMSGAIIAAGALAIAGLGLNFGIDFESGTRIKTPLERPASVDDVRDALAPLGLGDAEVQSVEEPELGQHVFQISTATLEPGEETKVRETLDQRYGVREADFSSNTIGPTFGAEIARTAVIAVIASLFLISMYIALRFEVKFAVPVLIALFHDILITAGVYALTDREVTTSTVAALLTILGYSLYDTIIVFDRIRENVPRMPRATFSQVVNRSMSEVITRSLVTSLSALFPISALLVFGGETLQDFAFALAIGVASGTYSSIFIAAPVLTEWKEREPVYRRRRQLMAEEHGGVVPAYAPGTLPGEEGEAAAAPRRRPAARRAAGARPAARPPTARPPAETPTAPGPERPPAAARGGPDQSLDPLTGGGLVSEPATDGGQSGGGAEGDGRPAESAVSSTAGPNRLAKQPKPKRARQRKRHGRR